MRALRWEGGGLSADRVAVMAILNITPDSFFDGGRYDQLELAVQRARQVAEEGADILDVGGESTRPGSQSVSVSEELDRVLPLIRALRKEGAHYPLPISIDTSRAEVAAAALEAGAEVVNDVSGGLREPEILEVAARRGAGLVLMHMRGTPETMQEQVHYADLCGEVLETLRQCCAAADAAGVPPEHQAVDPGIGFGKSPAGCLELLAELQRFRELHRAVLVGASRKSFLGRAFGHDDEDRLVGSVFVAGHAAMQGASIVRVHDVHPTRLAVDVAAGIRDASFR